MMVASRGVLQPIPPAGYHHNPHRKTIGAEGGAAQDPQWPPVAGGVPQLIPPAGYKAKAYR